MMQAAISVAEMGHRPLREMTAVELAEMEQQDRIVEWKLERIVAGPMPAVCPKK